MQFPLKKKKEKEKNNTSLTKGLKKLNKEFIKALSTESSSGYLVFWGLEFFCCCFLVFRRNKTSVSEKVVKEAFLSG